MASFFHTFFYTPIYNLLVFVTLYVPGSEVGYAIIVVTILVKLVLLPFSLSAVRTQKSMKHIEGKLRDVKELHKNDKEKQAREMMALYKEHNIRPFASIFAMFIQIPVVIALYFVFRGQSLPNVDPSLLYSFVHATGLHASVLFLGFIDLTQKNILLAAVAALSQVAQGIYTIPAPDKNGTGASDEFARAMNTQVRYILPLIIGFVAYTSGAIALYFITSAVFAIAQEYFVRKTHQPPVPATTV